MKFIFVGNRRFVLEEMISLGLHIELAFVMKNTHLEGDIIEMGIPYVIIDSKRKLLEQINQCDFDVLISNGCHYILPLKQLKAAQYINIHPSYLPDLKGIDPVIGAILNKRAGGATCHIMSDEIDAGDIVDQVIVPYSEDLDVGLMYQLAFIAEKQVFRNAYGKKFKPMRSQVLTGNELYYSRKPSDRKINFSEKYELIKSRINAFSNRSQGCICNIDEQIYHFHQVERLYNEFLVNLSKKYDPMQVLLNYENSIVYKNFYNEIILLRSLTDDLSKAKVGVYLIEVEHEVPSL